MVGSNEATTLAIIGVLATCVGGLLWLIKFMFTKLLPRFEKGNEVMNKLARNVKTNTEATKASDQYLRERNGRDSILHQKLVDEIRALPDKITQDIKEQHVAAQVVEKAIVKDKK